MKSGNSFVHQLYDLYDLLVDLIQNQSDNKNQILEPCTMDTYNINLTDDNHNCCNEKIRVYHKINQIFDVFHLKKELLNIKIDLLSKEEIQIFKSKLDRIKSHIFKDKNNHPLVGKLLKLSSIFLFLSFAIISLKDSKIQINEKKDNINKILEENKDYNLKKCALERFLSKAKEKNILLEKFYNKSKNTVDKNHDLEDDVI